MYEIEDREILPIGSSLEMIKALIKDFTGVLKIIKENQDTYTTYQLRAVYARHEWKALAKACDILPHYDQYYKYIIPKDVFQEQVDKDGLDFWGMYVQRNPDVPSAQTVYNDLKTAVDWLMKVKKTGDYDPELIQAVYESQAFCMIQGVLHRDVTGYTDTPYETRVEQALMPESPLTWNDYIESDDFKHYKIVIKQGFNEHTYNATLYKGVAQWVGKAEYDGDTADVKTPFFACWQQPTAEKVLDTLASMLSAINHEYKLDKLTNKEYQPWTITQATQN